jgi:DNA-binding NtrC family response regulator
MSSILIVNTDDSFRKDITELYKSSEHEVDFASDYRTAVKMLEKVVFDIIIFDTALSNGKSSGFVRQVKSINSNTMVIITTDRERTNEALEAISDGAFDFVQKPLQIPELQVKVERAISTRRLQQEADSLRGERNIIYNVDYFIGESQEIKEIFEIVEKIAKNDATVILNGEMGTGKELIAGAIHYNSHRADHAFVKVNCAALEDQVLQSELFGHEEGAVPDAEKQRAGKFEQADGGSIFLDEVGAMSPSLQSRLLRVMQAGEFERVGGKRTHRVNVRIIASTYKNLYKEIEEGRFREDLFYRLNTVTIHIPPLRERKGDILLLAYFFLKKFCNDMNKSLKELHPRTIKVLTEYPWPGNIRELQNAMERAVLMSEGATIKPDDLGIPYEMEPVEDLQNYIRIPPRGIRLEQVERELILQALKMSDWVQKDAAELLGVSSRVLNYKIKRFQITHPQWKRNK